MKKLLAFCSLLFIVASLHAEEGIQFNHGTWQEVLAQAKQQNKLVFIDVYTSWCGPCKMMVAEVFPQKPVGDLFNASFVNYKMDAEKGEGISVAKKYKVNAYPTYLFVDGNGELIYQISGYRPTSDFLKEAGIALKEKDDPKPIVKWDAEYKKGAMSKAFLLAYIRKKGLLKQSSADLVEEVFPLLTKQELADKEILSTVISSDYDVQYVPQGKVFNYVMKNYKALDSAKLVSYPLYTLQTGISNYFYKNIIEQRKEKMLPVMLNATKAVATALGTPAMDAALRQKELVMHYYRGAGNAEKLKPATIDFVRNGIRKLDIAGYQKADEAAFVKFMEPYLSGKTDSAKDQNYVVGKRLTKHQRMVNVSYKLRDAAEGIYKYSADTALLREATGWAKEANEWFPHFSNGAVYAALLFKTGETQKAIELMEVAGKDPIVTSGTAELQQLFSGNIELLKKGEAPTSLWRVAR